MRGRLAALALSALAAACSGGGSGGGTAACTVSCEAPSLLTEADVQRLLAQATAEARARGLGASIAVVDRVGNVLAVYETGAAPSTVDIVSGLVPAPRVAGLDGLRGTVPANQAAITKAITAAYLSSGGNAFSSRTAGQIVQEHFNPQEAGQPSGPLYGVQFSQLSCSDVNRNVSHGSVGPKRSPLGLAADPGGLPLYKGGVLVGGIGVEADGRYGFDRDLTDIDGDVEEAIALAGSAGFPVPDDIRAERITADGRSLRFVEADGLKSDPAAAPAFAAAAGRLVAVPGYNDGAVRRGTAFGSAASGVRADGGALAAAGAWVLADAAGANRFAPRSAPGAGGLAAGEVQSILAEALAVARRARGQIRRPLGSIAEVSVAVVDLSGDILGFARTADAPVFGIDVAVQKARTAMFFSSAEAASRLLAAPPATYLPTMRESSPGAYVTALRSFVADPQALTGAIAWSARAVGNVHRPAYPDGIDGAATGPLSTAFGEWSPFNVGLQLDLAYNQIVKGVLGDVTEGCAGRLPPGATPVAADTGIAALRNGLQVFPGGVPIYRDGRLVGGIGVSGDGVDQDDMVAYLGLANAAAALGNGLGNAPPAMRADTLAPDGVRLRYVQCPQSPFNGSSEQNACR
jgi:uncharacterized protein GlcG (DUF336 family)